MRGITLDDYLIEGPKTALDVISDITKSPKINITGLCLGGALTGMLASYLVRTGDDRINSVSLLNTMLDYSEPGVLGAFTDVPTIAKLERQMQAKGVLEGASNGGHLRHAPGERPDLQLCGVQLADGQAAAGVRHPRLERGQHPDAGRHALLLPSLALRQQRAGHREKWNWLASGCRWKT